MVVELTCKGGVDEVEAFWVDTVVLIDDVVVTAGTAVVVALAVVWIVVSSTADVVKKEALVYIGIEEMKVAVAVYKWIVNLWFH